MKRHCSSSEVTTYQPLLKKPKPGGLSPLQQSLAKQIPEFLENTEISLVKQAFKIVFGTPREVEKLLVYTHYEVFWWAIEHENFELMQFVIDRTTKRGKFLIVCHDNYETLGKLIDLSVSKMQQGTYQASNIVETIRVLVEANPDKLDLIMETVTKLIEVKALKDSGAVSRLKTDFTNIFAPLAEEDEAYLNESPDLTDHSLNNDYSVAGLAGELS